MLTPRPYQQEGIDFLLKKRKALLADAPGIGKTLQAALAAYDHKPVLVSSPTYLTEQWFDFLQEQFPGDTVSLARGPRKLREAALCEGCDWTIINHEMMRGSYKIPSTPTVIFDESHHLRGRKAQQTRGAWTLAKAAEYVFLLTATPIVREPDDLWAQLHMLDPLVPELRSYWRFVQRFCSFSVTPWGSVIAGARPGLKRFLDQYKLERSYKDVGLYLPDLISNTIHVRFGKESSKAYRSIRDHYRLEDITFDSAAEVLHILRGVTACTEKFDATLALAAEYSSYCIFTWYKHSAQNLAAKLNVPVITGDLAPVERRTTALNNDRIVATIASLSEGVDLSHIKVVIFFEEEYTPGGMYQALSRLRRWSAHGSLDPILCYYMHVRDSIDETIHRIQTRRAYSARDLVKMELSR